MIRCTRVHRSHISYFTLALCAWSLAALWPAGTIAATIRVPADQPTIQAAVNAAHAGDTVRVSPGDYVESVRVKGNRVGLIIEAADPANPPHLHGIPNKSTDGVRVDRVDGITLRNLRISGAYDAVRLNYVRNGLLIGLYLENSAMAVRVNHGQNNRVTQCVIVGTRVEQGIGVDSSPGVILVSNTILNSDSEGIRVLGSAGAILDDNHVTNSLSDRVKGQPSPHVVVEHCTASANRGNGFRVSNVSNLMLIGNTADHNRGVGLRVEQCSPFVTIGDVLAAGNTAVANLQTDILVVPPANASASTRATTSTTTSTTTLGTNLAPLVSTRWNFSVRIATAGASMTNVNVPNRSQDPPVEAMIRGDHMASFVIGNQTSGAEIAALGGDTLQRLTAAADAYLRSHPADYPGFTSVVELRWARRVSP